MINERRHQLHEVIRLSGMNLVINDVDMPLVIKVASIPKERMQVYFIDNEDYLREKGLLKDSKGNLFKDNDERMIFFTKGVIETVKKLNWSPDIYHLQWLVHMFISSLYENLFLLMNQFLIQVRLLPQLFKDFDNYLSKKLKVKWNLTESLDLIDSLNLPTYETLINIAIKKSL